jgi:phosphoribosyl 1,2-cyclic phosphodiesterase
MKVVTLASGSKGNCTLIQTEKSNILVDAGIKITEIESRLIKLGIDPSLIDAIIITHEHIDHIKSVGLFARKYGCKVYAHNLEWQVLEDKIGYIKPEQQKDFFGTDFYINDLTVSSFELSHDCNLCLGYSFFNCGNKVSIATDLGIVTPLVIKALKDSSLVILEANHDEKLLLNNSHYSYALKNRILSNKGHLSNITSGEAIAQLVGGQLQQVVLAHLSEENNSPSLAYNTIKTELLKKGIIEGENVFIDVSTQHKIGNIFNLKDKNK